MAEKQKERIRKLLEQFDINVTGFEVHGSFWPEPDVLIYVLTVEEDNKWFDRFYIYEEDYIESLEQVERRIREEIGNFSKFIPVKRPIKEFEKANPVKGSEHYDEPENWDSELSKFVTDQFTSSPSNFAFLVKK